jgi:tRNA pseudouridine38-40 synthase
VQQVLEEAFLPLVGGTAPPVVNGASRTDAGVHAYGQVASVQLAVSHDAGAIQRALNVRLPVDVRVLDVRDAPEGFHARYDARGKAYRYHVVTAPVATPFERWFVWHAPGPRDVEAMRQAAAVLVGRHDFASFQATGSSVPDAVRTITRLEIQEAPGALVFEVDGDGFLRHMVRAIVGTLCEMGSGSRDAAAMSEILAARSRPAAGRTAPASGLTLVEVRY